jgi:hypothetical protein
MPPPPVQVKLLYACAKQKMLPVAMPTWQIPLVLQHDDEYDEAWLVLRQTTTRSGLRRLSLKAEDVQQRRRLPVAHVEGKLEEAKLVVYVEHVPTSDCFQRKLPPLQNGKRWVELTMEKVPPSLPPMNDLLSA